MFDRRLMKFSTPLFALVAILTFVSCKPTGGPAQDVAQPVTQQPTEAAPITTPLDDYVAAPDPAFFFDKEPAAVVKENGYTASTYLMTSQTWLDASLVDKPEWKHWVTVVVPDEVAHSEALLAIGGGNNKRTEPPEPDAKMGQIAVLTKSVLVGLAQIPSEPLKFPDEQDDRYKEKGRTEDEIIAYGWDKFLVNGDPIWLSRLPMTKAAVRAMDLAQEVCPDIDSFVVVGASKRGWTTWTTGAVDKRVKAIVPAVIDVLNVAKSLNHHWAAYGFWAPAIGDYKDMRILARLNTPEFAALEDVVDPYTYIDRLTMPKYIVSSAGDQFFLPDSWRFYWDDLKGEKHLRYIPNTDHGLNADAYMGLAAFHHAMISGVERPKYEWQVEGDGSIVLKCETSPSKVTLWQATNPDARDFRLESLGPKYESSPMEPGADGVYRAAIPAPEKGWTAFLVEMEFPCGDFPIPFKFSTGVSVVPDTLPFKDTPQPQ